LVHFLKSDVGGFLSANQTPVSISLSGPKEGLVGGPDNEIERMRGGGVLGKCGDVEILSLMCHLRKSGCCQGRSRADKGLWLWWINL